MAASHLDKFGPRIFYSRIRNLTCFGRGKKELHTKTKEPRVTFGYSAPHHTCIQLPTTRDKNIYNKNAWDQFCYTCVPSAFERGSG